MTNSVSLLGLFAPTPGARDAKANEDNALVSFAGMLAGVNLANAKLLVPPPQVESGIDGEALENPEGGSGDSKKADDATDVSSATPIDTASPVSPTNAVVTPAAVASMAPLAVDSSVATLNPALQEKLARVISRVREETGHDVQVTETYRSQARQNVLYAQGRQTAGPVVTWTQSSKHTLGRAVDVTLDGGQASADAYTALQRIANEEGLRTLGARDPGHLELPSSDAAAQIAQSATVEQVTNVGAGTSPAAKLSPTTYLKAIKSPDANISTPANVARVAGVAQVAAVASVGTGPVTRSVRSNATGANAQHVASHNPQHLGGEKNAKQNVAVEQQVDAPSSVDRAELVRNEADAITSAPGTDVASATVDDNSLMSQMADAPGPTTPSAARPSHRQLEISNLDRLSDAVNATRVEDGSVETRPSGANGGDKTQVTPNDAGIARTRMAPRAQAVLGAHAAVRPAARGTQANAKTQTEGADSTQFSTAPLGRSANSGGDFAGDRGQSGDRDATGYSAMSLRGETASQFSVADVSTEMTSTASQRAERIMAAQDAPARPLSQIVMSVDAGNGTTDRIQVALRGSTVSATIDAADHHAADAMRAHSDELVRSLTRDGVDVDSLRVRSTAATTASPVTTIDSSRKSSDSSSNSRFNREAQWDQQRSQQRSNSERRQNQRDQRGGKES